MHTLLISNELNKRMQSRKPLSIDTLHGVLQERGGFIDGGGHRSLLYWKTPRIGMTLLDNRTMDGHPTHGWILQHSDG
jgi:hypothetical protein